jgi:hypothetical protein
MSVVACPSEKDEAVAFVELHGAGVHQRFEVSTETPDGDQLFAEPARLVTIPAPAIYGYWMRTQGRAPQSDGGRRAGPT